MNDILAKPFTKDGMVKILKKYLKHMLKVPEAHAFDMETTGTPAPFSSAPSASTPAFALATSNMKLETTPINSPATSTSWHSPSTMMQQASPNMENGGYMTTGVHVSAAGPQMSQMVKTPGGLPMQAPGTMATGNFASQLHNPSAVRHRMSDMASSEAKRQRLSYEGAHAAHVPFPRR